MAHAKGFESAEYLLTALHVARLTKDEAEIELIREANRISSVAHELLMRELGKYSKRRSGVSGKGTVWERSGKEAVAEWEMESEGDAEALFVAACKRSGYVHCRFNDSELIRVGRVKLICLSAHLAVEQARCTTCECIPIPFGWY